MTYDTINDANTIPGNGEGTLLAGRYRVIRRLGQGGMGSVWLAEDAQLDGKPFAIKMLPSILVSNKRAYRQLKDEALVAMKLTHPNIVTLRAFEENNGNPFLVMDYIDGQTLDDYLAEKGTFAEDDVIRVLRPIAAALDYAHSKGVVHRDVKPGNVMVAKDGTPCILDFGIAREIQETMTRVTGKLSSGTLLYMSPEQLMGESPKPAQDIYSFAAMAYECLKGEPPFARGNIEFQIMNKRPEPLVGRVIPNAPLVASVMAGLAKNPEDRPATCAAVLEGKNFNHAEHVDRVEGGGNGRTRSPSGPQPVGSRVPRDRTGGPRPVAAVKGILAAALLGLAVAGGIMWHGHRQRQQNEALRQARIVAEQKAEAERLAAERKAQEAAARRRADEERKAKEEAERRRKAEEEARLAAERKAKDAATEIRIEAKVQQGKVARISDGDGFKARKDALEDVFIRAEAFYDEKARRWTEAGALYKDYIEQSKSVITLDGERQQALAKRSAAQAAFRNAEAEGAKTYARESWNAAVKTWNEAADEFKRMEFASAAETFAKALREFDGCAEEAQRRKRAEEEKLAEKKRMAEAREAERRRQEEAARQAEARRRQEERRKAMQSLPGKWKCSTVFYNQEYKEYKVNLHYEYDFFPNGDFRGRQTHDDGSTTTSEGRWTLSGNRLTIQRTSNVLTLPESKRSIFSSGRHTYKGCTTKHIVLWRNDGSFELRLIEWPHIDEKTQRSIRYDSEGKEIVHTKREGNFLTSYEYEYVETAKIFRRVSN